MAGKKGTANGICGSRFGRTIFDEWVINSFAQFNAQSNAQYYDGHKGRYKNNLYTSSVEFGMVTQGPTEDTDGWMLTGCNLEDYIDVDVGFLDD